MEHYIGILYGGVNNAYIHDTVVLEAENYEAAKKQVAIHWGLNDTGRDCLGRHAGVSKSKKI